MSKNKSDFEVMQEMATRNLDIRSASTIIEIKTVKKGGAVTIGVDDQCLHDLVLNPDDYLLALYVVNKQQYHEIKGT